MNEIHSDALVLFGATGDLAYEKVFPALQAMVKRRHLEVPIIGVAHSGRTPDQLKVRAGTWGPPAVGQSVVPRGGWQDPVVTT